ncbi:sugar porter family MFS transporter [Enemella evansiae]|uniref:sugar porter family MFS transporter n=1 Tax=Enemella evansiae TaxID=2016499 RepID=UPI00105BED1F|nr:sugar porter family MFS transporter [Enemella evansiae]TDO92563.1 SP family arabinose:H+ symporter-like MFS transporter/SP family xylose:H+ symportor-like MFS transporter [Enemella evansiae]
MPKRSAYPIAISVIASLAGLLFGYDTAVIAGAIGFLGDYFALDAVQTGFAVSSALIGCVIGAAVSGWISDKLGRRTTLFLAAILYTASAIGCALAWDFTSFWLLRVVGGLGIGLSAIVPAYITEISPAAIRGRLTSVYQLAITVGILLVYIVNNLVANAGDPAWQVSTAWRIMLASEGVPAIHFLVLILFLPESPRWLVARGREEKAAALLTRLEGVEDPTRVPQIKEDLAREERAHAVKIFTKALLPIVLLASAIAALQQLVGINVIIYYGTEMMAQMNIADPFLQQVLIGSVNVGATVLGMLVVDRWGRRPLLIIGTLGVAAMISVVGIANLTQSTGTWVMIFIVGYIVLFAATLGSLAWLVIAELPPSLARAKIVAFATMVLWLANVAVAQTFPMINQARFNVDVMHGALPYFIYGFFGVVFFFVAYFFVPETKGRTLEDLSERTIAHAEESGQTEEVGK